MLRACCVDVRSLVDVRKNTRAHASFHAYAPQLPSADDTTPPPARLQQLLLSLVAHRRSDLYAGECTRAVDAAAGAWAVHADGQYAPLSLPSVEVAAITLLSDRLRRMSAHDVLVLLSGGCALAALAYTAYRRHGAVWLAWLWAAGGGAWRGKGGYLEALAQEEEEEARQSVMGHRVGGGGRHGGGWGARHGALTKGGAGHASADEDDEGEGDVEGG
eukprot:762823-Prymnesium_polylepis.1